MIKVDEVTKSIICETRKSNNTHPVLRQQFNYKFVRRGRLFYQCHKFLTSLIVQHKSNRTNTLKNPK